MFSFLQSPHYCIVLAIKKRSRLVLVKQTQFSGDSPKQVYTKLFIETAKKIAEMWELAFLFLNSELILGVGFERVGSRHKC